MRVSTIEQTVLDLARYSDASGGWDNVASVLVDLAPAIDVAKFSKLAQLQLDVRPMQRLGYLLDVVAHAEAPALALASALVKHAPRYIPFEPKARTSNVKRDVRWHLLLNRAIDTD